MNFQRGLAPTEAMGVGQIALAPEIKTLYHLDPTSMSVGKNGKAFPRRNPVFSPEKILHELEANRSAYNTRFLAFTTGTEFDEFGDEVIHRLSEYKGLFVKFGEETYKIPK
jgi:hypothetical protein